MSAEGSPRYGLQIAAFLSLLILLGWGAFRIPSVRQAWLEEARVPPEASVLPAVSAVLGLIAGAHVLLGLFHARTRLEIAQGALRYEGPFARREMPVDSITGIYLFSRSPELETVTIRNHLRIEGRAGRSITVNVNAFDRAELGEIVRNLRRLQAEIAVDPRVLKRLGL